MWIRTVFVAAGLVLSGCGSMANQDQRMDTVLPVTVVATSVQCNLGDRALNGRFVKDDAEVSQLLQRMAGNRVGAADVKPADFDFARQHAVLISLGAKPTPGYGLEVAAEAVIDADVLRLEVTPTSPPPGMMLAQVITTPCMLLTLPQGQYQSLVLVDKASGAGLLRIPLENAR